MEIATRRRRVRRTDPLSDPAAVRDVLKLLHLSMPELVSDNEKHAIQILRAAKYASRTTIVDSKRGRPRRWSSRDLLKVKARVNAILHSKGASIGLVSFVDYYLRILDFPSDVVAALRSGEINLYEGQQLARIRSGVNGWSATEARRLRASLLAAHLQAGLSGRRLQERVVHALNAEGQRQSASEPGIPDIRDQLGEFDLSDTSHLFWDELRLLGTAYREIEREDLTDNLLEALLRASEKVWRILAKIKKRADRRRTAMSV
jgi:hypothetical protein